MFEAILKLIESNQTIIIHRHGRPSPLPANSRLRSMLAERTDLRCIFPPLKLCTDNAAMIASEGLVQFRLGTFAEMNLTAKKQQSFLWMISVTED